MGQEKKSASQIPNVIPEKIKNFIVQSDSLEKIENLIINTLSKDKDTTLAIAYCNAFLQRGKLEESYTIQYFSSYQIAYIKYMQSDYVNTVKNAYIAAKAAENAGDTIRNINSNILLGSAYYLMGVYDETLQPYLKAKELSKQIKNLPYEIICLTNITNSRMKLKRYKDALISYDSIIETLRKETNENFIQYRETYLSALLGRGKCLAEMEELDKALATYNEGVELAENNDLLVYKSYFYINLGDVYYKKKEYYKALGFLNEGKDILKQNVGGQQTNLYIANYYIARCFYQQKKYQESISLLDKNIALIGNIIDADKIEDMYLLAIEVSKALDDQKSQILYYDKLQKIIQAKTDKRLLAKDLLYEDDIKEYKIENKKLENEKIKNAISKRLTFIISMILLALLLVGFYIYRRRVKNKEQKFYALIENLQNKKSIEKPIIDTLHLDIRDEKGKGILKKLQNIENTHFFLSQDCNLYSTAKLLNTNTTYLSKALNETGKQSFNQYINELRINHALLKLKDDPIFRSYTIRAVARETGYKSHTTFIKAFKSKTGVTPAFYVKKLEVN